MKTKFIYFQKRLHPKDLCKGVTVNKTLEKHSVCSIVPWYILQPSDVWQFSCHNDCSQLQCEFSALKKYDPFFLTLHFNIQIWIICESFSFCLGNDLISIYFPNTYLLFMWWYICNIIYESMRLLIFFILHWIYFFFKHFNENIYFQW